MDERFEKDDEAGTERGRSPSGVPASGAEGVGPGGVPWDGEGPESGSMSPRKSDPKLDGGEEGSILPPPQGEIAEEPGVGVGDLLPRIPERRGRRRGRRLVRSSDEVRGPLSATKKILLLDLWNRSGLPARDFAGLTGLSHHTLYLWRAKFKLEGPAGLMEKPRGAPGGSRLPEVTKRAMSPAGRPRTPGVRSSKEESYAISPVAVPPPWGDTSRSAIAVATSRSPRTSQCSCSAT